MFNEASRGATYRRRERARALMAGADWSLPAVCGVTTPLARAMLLGFMNANVAFSPAEWGERFSEWHSILEGLIFVADGELLFFENIGMSKKPTLRIAHPVEIPATEQRRLKQALMAGRLRRLGYVLGPEFDLGDSTVAMRSLSTRYDIVLGPVGLRLGGPQIDGIESVIKYVKVYPIKSGSPSWSMLGEEGRHQEQKVIPRAEWPRSVACEIAEDLHALAK